MVVMRDAEGNPLEVGPMQGSFFFDNLDLRSEADKIARQEVGKLMNELVISDEDEVSVSF